MKGEQEALSLKAPCLQLQLCRGVAVWTAVEEAN